MPVSQIEVHKRASKPCYELQSRTYSLTRWAFLFGRRKIVRQLPFPIEKKVKILEVGCGTGYNLRQLCRWFPNASLTGMDVSPHIITRAGEAIDEFGCRVELIQEPYTFGCERFNGKMDAILFSYVLTRANPHWKELVRQAREDLRPGGIIAVVDFHASRFGWFRRHMANHHVRMDGHLLPLLQSRFRTLSCEIQPTYGGLWEYFLFRGRKE